MRRTIAALAALSALAIVPSAAQAGEPTSNWAGYIAVQGPPTLDQLFPTYVNGLEAQIVVPELNCKKTKHEVRTSVWAAGGNGIAVWTGIDGYGPGKGYIEQAGIAGACLRGGRPVWRGFWQMYRSDASAPGDHNAHHFPEVQPGDTIDTIIEAQESSYEIAETDWRPHPDVGTPSGAWAKRISSTDNLDAPNVTGETVVELPGGATSLTAWKGLITTVTLGFFGGKGGGFGGDCLVEFYANTPCSTVHKVALQGLVGLTPARNANTSSEFSATYK